MQELDQALSDIVLIRRHLARYSEFRGYGAATVAATGALALLMAAGQALWLKHIAQRVDLYVLSWAMTAAASFLGIAIEAACRCRRIHGALAWVMLQSALEEFLPAIMAGGLLTVVLLRTTPGSAWMLPGLWQILFSLGVFGSWRALPRPIFAVGVWYLACGLACLALLSGPKVLSPWAMGIPFGVGQIMVAVALRGGEAESPSS
jgi:hypothetical protein